MKYIYLLLICTTFAFGQTSYTNGQDGIEMFYKSSDTMYVYQQRQAKMSIRGEVALEILDTYLKKKNLGGKKTVCTSQGEVTGFLTIIRKPKMVVLEFQYLSILWNDGTLEKTIVKKHKKI
jgi:hypothetical protein